MILTRRGHQDNRVELVVDQEQVLEKEVTVDDKKEKMEQWTKVIFQNLFSCNMISIELDVKCFFLPSQRKSK